MSTDEDAADPIPENPPPPPTKGCGCTHTCGSPDVNVHACGNPSIHICGGGEPRNIVSNVQNHNDDNQINQYWIWKKTKRSEKKIEG